jgi:hypothetical protein
MANRVLVNEDSLKDIAAAIKEQSGDYETSFTPGEMGNAIRNLPIGEGGGSGSNIYVDGFSILQDEDGRIYTAIGGGYANGGGGGTIEPMGPMILHETYGQEGKADTDGWIKLSTLEDGTYADLFNTNQDLAIEIRDYEFNYEGDGEPEGYHYKEMKLVNWDYNVGLFEYDFTDQWAYSKLRFVGGEVWIYQTQRENVDDYNNDYTLTGFTLYAIRERLISSNYLNDMTCPDDGMMTIQLTDGSLFNFVDVWFGQYYLYIDLMNMSGETQTAKVWLGLDYFEDIDGGYAEFWVDGDYTGLLDKVIFEGGMVRIRIKDPATFNANYTLQYIHIYQDIRVQQMSTFDGMGGSVGGGIIPINGEFIPVDNDTIYYDYEWGVIRANATPEWRVEEMINEALANFSGGGDVPSGEEVAF